MIERPPKIDAKAYANYFIGRVDDAVYPIVERINEDYEYWDNAKYKKPLPHGVTPEMLWSYVKASRLLGLIKVWPKYGVKLQVTNKMQRFCHEFDMNFGSFWDSDAPAAKTEKMQYQTYSLMEEAIYSSTIEPQHSRVSTETSGVTPSSSSITISTVKI